MFLVKGRTLFVGVTALRDFTFTSSLTTLMEYVLFANLLMARRMMTVLVLAVGSLTILNVDLIVTRTSTLTPFLVRRALLEAI